MKRLCVGAAAGLFLLQASPAVSQPLIISLAPQPGDALSIDGRIGDDAEPFLFDSGWGVSAVTPNMATRIGCKPWGQIVGYRAIGKRVDAQQCQPTTIDIAGKPLRLSMVALVDLQRYMPAGSPAYSGAIGLDAFAGKAITIRMKARQIVVETARSLRERTMHETSVSTRMVRDSQGAALTVDLGIPTASGMLWMELDTGNQGGMMVNRKIAKLLGLNPDVSRGQEVSVPVVPGVVINQPVQVLDLIMDGNIGADFLTDWDLTLDLANGRGWLGKALTR